MSGLGGGHGALDALRIGYVTRYEQSTDFVRDGCSLSFIQVEDGDFRASGGQSAYGRCT